MRSSGGSLGAVMFAFRHMHVVLFLKQIPSSFSNVTSCRHLSQTSRISKTFSEFRALASDLRRAAKQLGDSNATPAVKQVKKAAQTVSLLMDGGELYIERTMFDMFI